MTNGNHDENKKDIKVTVIDYRELITLFLGGEGVDKSHPKGKKVRSTEDVMGRS